MVVFVTEDFARKCVERELKNSYFIMLLFLLAFYLLEIAIVSLMNVVNKEFANLFAILIVNVVLIKFVKIECAKLVVEAIPLVNPKKLA